MPTRTAGPAEHLALEREALTQLVAHRTAQDKTGLFFAATFAITWSLQLPALLAHWGLASGPPEKYLALTGLGGLGPLLAAMLASWREPGGVRALFAPLKTWRVGFGWYPLALFLPGAIFSVGMAVRALFGGADAGPWFYWPSAAPLIIAMVVFPVGEEFGWRGFALPRLLRVHGAVRASLLLGLIWGVWHLPMFLLVGIKPRELALMAVFFPAASLVFTWLYRHTRGSMLLALLMHMGAHLNNPHRALPGNAIPLVVHTIGYALVAVALVIGDRKAWRSTVTAIAD
jgi:membrane protease YdiL (CAAX protease family)